MPRKRRKSEFAELFAAREAVQTPCSTVYLTARSAYKVKKAVHLVYLDFTTLAARKHACEEEIRLNAELAPRVYQAVVPIAQKRLGQMVMVGTGKRLPRGAEVVEYAVKMRRLPAEGMLTAILNKRELSNAEVEAIVSRLISFHAAADAGPAVRRHGSPEAVRSELLGNIEQIKPFVGGARGLMAGRLYAHLRRWIERQLEVNRPLLKRRATAGRIREGHGDLHAGNICFDPAARARANPTGLIIYDRLEFREDFRCKDVAAELACLASTFDARGHHELADAVVRMYSRRTGDVGMLTLQPMYRAHYAAVRGKVHAMRSRQRGVPPDERRREAEGSSGFLQLAVGYTLPASLLITCGLPGSGKSVASRAAGAALRARIHRADEIRKELAGLQATERGGKTLYTPEMTRRTYGEMLRRCRADLRGGRSAIADATFRGKALRAGFIAAARAMGVPVVVLYCKVGAAETKRRLAARTAADADASDADFSVYRRMLSEFDAPTARECRVVTLTPSKGLVRFMAEVLTALQNQAPGPGPKRKRLRDR